MKKNTWLLLIFAIALSFSAITFWSIYRASSGVSSVTDPAYYSHGLKYNSTSIESLAAETMGWQVESILTGGRLNIRLHDAAGAAISGASGEITFTPVTPNQTTSQTTTLHEEKRGSYSTALPPQLPRTTYANIVIRKGKTAIRRRLLLNLPAS